MKSNVHAGPFLFYLRFSSTRRLNNIAVVRTYTNTYGKKSWESMEKLESFGPQIWNSLPEHIKAEISFPHLRSLTNNWFGKECFCNQFKHTRTLSSTNYLKKSDVAQIGLFVVARIMSVFMTILTYCNY